MYYFGQFCNLLNIIKKEPTQKGRFLVFYLVMMSCRKAPPEFRFASSTLRNFVPSGAAHEAAAGHALGIQFLMRDQNQKD